MEQLLFCAEAGEQGYTALRAALGEDEDGMKMLFCLSRCAARAHGLYRARGIPEEIYTQTMEFLSRFAESDTASSPCSNSASARSNTR